MSTISVMDWYYHKVLLIMTVLQIVTSEFILDTSSENSTVKDSEDSTRILSRRKRFLTFPEGSSFQLVFCVQTAALIPIGDIFLYGNTAALAWNLPADPKFLHMLKGENMAQRKEDLREIYYLDSNGKLIAKVPYKRKPIINPAFAKRSVDENLTFKEKLRIKIDRIKMHERQLNREYLNKSHLDENSVEFHRSSRVGLYEKIEKLLTAMGRDGRQCVLHKLCEAARSSMRQGTFLQELLRVVFTLPKGKEFQKEEHRVYDKAHTFGEHCATLYPSCAPEIPVDS